MATFSGLVVNTPGTYTLTASDASLTSATSGSFTIASSLTVTALQSVAASIATPFDSLQVTFSEPINLSSFIPSQVQLLYGGSPTSTSSVTLKSDGGDVYEVDGLSGLPATPAGMC